MSDKPDNTYDDDLAVQEVKPRVKRPPLYKVILLNDDYTPMDFVVHILEAFFSVDRENATRIMLQIHTHGKGVCGIYTHEIQKQKSRWLMIIRVKTSILFFVPWKKPDR